MHILLTDVLTCPRCGPQFGLVVLADRMEARRVVSGHLGCANCRSRYPVRAGVADLRPPDLTSIDSAASAHTLSTDASGDPGDPVDATDSVVATDSVDAKDPDAGGGEAAVRLAALMGLAGANGMAMIAGPDSAHAAAVAALVPELEVIAVSASPVSAGADEDGARVSRVLAADDRLPLRGGLRAAALSGGADESALREGLRVLAPGARLVVSPAHAETAERLRALGAEVLLAEGDVVVARAPGRPVELRYNAVR